MLRWYDYLVAFFVADFIQSGFFGTIDAILNPEVSIWILPLSLLVFYGWYAWIWKGYEDFRVKLENHYNEQGD